MLSVVMPVYNCADYLHEAIESVLSQTHTEFEFIIVDDGSTDETADIIDSIYIKDSRLRVLRTNHIGISRALNLGINNARYEVIARMDGDDVCEPMRFERQLNYLKEHPEIDLLGTYVSEVLGGAPENVVNKKLRGFNTELTNDNIEFFLLNEYLLFHPSWMFKKKVFNTIGGYNSRYDGAEDYDFLLRAFGGGFKLHNLQEGLIKLRLTKNSSSRRNFGGNPESVRNCIHIKLDYLEKKIDFRTVTAAVWGTGIGGESCLEVLRERYPGMKVVCFYDRDKEGMFAELPMRRTKDIDFGCFDLLIGATEPGKPDIFRLMEENNKELYKDFIILVW